MPSIGARLFTTTAIAMGGLTLAACQGTQQQATSLDGAVHTQALMAAVSNRSGKMQDRYAAEAEAARRAGDLDAAIGLAEQAIALDTNDEGARRTLASSYFAAGRLDSATEAYADLLAMKPAANTHTFGAALTALANGNTARAHLMLRELASDPARMGDVGLAYVLLGDLERGKALLETAVRSGSSSSQTRQNLALAQALSGDWNLARVTAAIDLMPAEVDARVSEWAALSVSEDTAWRTAMLLNLNPAVSDPGRPVALAWSPPMAEAPVHLAESAIVSQEPVQTGEPSIHTADASAPAAVTILTEAALAPIEITSVPAPLPVTAPPVVAPIPVAKPARLVNASTLSVAPRAANFTAKPQSAAPETGADVKAEQKPKEVSALPELPKAGEGQWLVQLGSYDRLEWVKDNWTVLKTENKFLSEYNPIRSKTEIDGRTYYRLSVGRFTTRDDATALCKVVQSKGESCFVREGKFRA